jgi:ABC-2 type transport system permease protein
MRFWQLFLRNLKETYRDPMALGFLLAFPLLFMVVFGAALGNAAEITPGIIVFGLLIMIPTSARIMTRDKEKGYLARLLTTPTHPWEFVTGYAFCLLLIATAQIVFFVLVGWLFGLEIAGSLVLAFLIFLLTALASIGIGMVVASVTRSENQAEPLTWIIAMPLAVLSSVWFPLSVMPNAMQFIANLFPFAHAVEASTEVLLNGAGLSVVQNDIIFISGWAAGAILLGIFLFGRTMRG